MENQPLGTPPPELVQRWLAMFYEKEDVIISDAEMHIAKLAAQWGIAQYEKLMQESLRIAFEQLREIHKYKNEK